MLEIDGGLGEAGGQILRTSLSLSCLLNKPFRIFNIRKGRKKPGLMPQHLACVRAMSLISDASVNHDSIGSQELIFAPLKARAGAYLFDIGTAGSTSLVLQTLLPCLIFAGGKSSVTLKGGTHVPFSPVYHYVSEVFIPMLRRLGVNLSAKITDYGFYPQGGGAITVEIMPAQKISGLTLVKQGVLEKLTGISAAGNLPLSIAERQKASALKILQGFDAYIESKEVRAKGQGTFIFLKSETSSSIAGFSSLGARGKKAETVGAEAAMEFLDYYKTGSCLDPHLADQIVLYLALSDEESTFSVSRISDHLLTNLRIIEKFTGIKYRLEGNTGSPGLLSIKGNCS